MEAGVAVQIVAFPHPVRTAALPARPIARLSEGVTSELAEWSRAIKSGFAPGLATGVVRDFDSPEASAPGSCIPTYGQVVAGLDVAFVVDYGAVTIFC